jgi:NAD-dependent SIR2 family protein deacetylase
MILPQYVSQLWRGLPLILEDGTNELTVFSRRLFASLYDELLSLEERRRELPLVEVNTDQTKLTPQADVVLRGKAGDILSALRSQLLASCST